MGQRFLVEVVVILRQDLDYDILKLGADKIEFESLHRKPSHLFGKHTARIPGGDLNLEPIKEVAALQSPIAIGSEQVEVGLHGRLQVEISEVATENSWGCYPKNSFEVLFGFHPLEIDPVYPPSQPNFMTGKISERAMGIHGMLVILAFLVTFGQGSSSLLVMAFHCDYDLV